MARVTRIAIIGGGPGGYEAALVALQLGAQVTLIDRDGAGGSAVLTDCVPSKTLIATAEVMSVLDEGAELGVHVPDEHDQHEHGQHDHGQHDHGLQSDQSDQHDVHGVAVDLAGVNARVRALAAAQSADIRSHMDREGVRWVEGIGRLAAPGVVELSSASGATERLEVETVLIATGAHPRVLPEAMPDGERILTWEQLYGLTELPARLIVVGSGVTGAEFASAYQALGSHVVLVSSRDRVLPGEDPDAALVLEEVFRRRGMEVLSKARAAGVQRVGDGVVVTLADGRTLEGSHCLMAVGSVPNTAGIGLEEAGIRLGPGGFVEVDRVSRTSVRGVYAAGDCTGVLMLASVAAMQGRIAMEHTLGDAVQPLDLGEVSSNVFTDPEIATVGVTQNDVDSGVVEAVSVKLPLATNPRAKMQGVHDGFVKLFALPGTRIIVGGVVVAPRASELIFPITIAIAHRLTVDELAHTFTIYPSLTGSIAEAARLLHRN